MLPPSDQPDRRSPEARLRAWWSATARGSTPGEVDVAAATTITGFVGLLVAALQAVLLVLHPPTDGIGPAGWVLAGLAITAGATASWSLVDRGTPLSVDQLLGVTVIGMAEVGLIVALAGGEPERELLLLWLAFGVAISSPTRAFMVLGVAYLTALLPLIGDSPDSREGAQLLIDALLWAALAALVALLFARLRRQRQASREDRVALTELARRDELTGLGNRRALQEVLEEVERAVEEGADPCTIGIFDLTGFKQINDRQGLREGDRCLQLVGQALERTLAAPARAFRWGGDEFVVVLPGRPLAAAAPAVQHVQAALADCCRDSNGRALATRWGVAELGPEISLADALAAADLELLEQKGLEREPGSPGGSPASRARLDSPAKGSAEAETPRPGR